MHRLGGPLALRRRRSGRDPVVHGPRLAGLPRVGRQLRRRRRDPSVELDDGRARAAPLGVRRPRPGRTDHVGRPGPPGRPAPHRARPPRRPGHAQGDGEARHPDLDPRRAGLHLRRDPRLGRAAVPDDRPDRPRARELGVAEGPPRRAGPPRLHPERRQQDPGGPVRGASRARRARVGPVEWTDLDDPELRPDRWTIRSVLDRVQAAGDPLRPLIGLDQRLPKL